MAHWAELDENNVVLRVTVGDNNDPDEGYQWLIDNLGGTWVKTSYNNKIRVRYAAVGMTYDETLDAFIRPKCHDEATLNETTCDWECNNAAHDIEE
jgi:hypothetical protein